MKIQKQNKKFNLEKFKVAKFKNLKVIKGGQNGDDPKTDDQTITDNVVQQSGIRCLKDNIND